MMSFQVAPEQVNNSDLELEQRSVVKAGGALGEITDEKISDRAARDVTQLDQFFNAARAMPPSNSDRERRPVDDGHRPQQLMRRVQPPVPGQSSLPRCAE